MRRGSGFRSLFALVPHSGTPIVIRSGAGSEPPLEMSREREQNRARSVTLWHFAKDPFHTMGDLMPSVIACEMDKRI